MSLLFAFLAGFLTALALCALAAAWGWLELRAHNSTLHRAFERNRGDK